MTKWQRGRTEFCWPANASGAKSICLSYIYVDQKSFSYSCNWNGSGNGSLALVPSQSKKQSRPACQTRPLKKTLEFSFKIGVGYLKSHQPLLLSGIEASQWKSNSSPQMKNIGLFSSNLCCSVVFQLWMLKVFFGENRIMPGWFCLSWCKTLFVQTVCVGWKLVTPFNVKGCKRL